MQGQTHITLHSYLSLVEMNIYVQCGSCMAMDSLKFSYTVLSILHYL